MQNNPLCHFKSIFDNFLRNFCTAFFCLGPVHFRLSFVRFWANFLMNEVKPAKLFSNGIFKLFLSAPSDKLAPILKLKDTKKHLGDLISLRNSVICQRPENGQTALLFLYFARRVLCNSKHGTQMHSRN